MWEHVGTYAFASFMASLGGLWYYFDTHDRKRRRVGEALISMLGSGLLGLVVSLVSCYYLCEKERALPLVVAISAMSGLLGWTPQYALAIFRAYRLKDISDDEQKHGFRDSPDSDLISPDD